MRIHYSADYVAAATEWDTTRKAAWVAASLAERPIPGVEIVAPAPLSTADLERVHARTYVAAVQTGEPGELAGSNGIGWDERLFDAVAASSGGAVAAARHALATGTHAGSLSSGLHHARHDEGAGYCTFNGLALAADAALRAGAERLLILDLDAHCGGGTASIVERVAAFAGRTIIGIDVATSDFDHYRPPTGWTLDVVYDAADYLPTIKARLGEVAARRGRFDLVLYNAGMDPFEGCVVGGLDGIDAAMLDARERLVFQYAQALGPVAFVLAGGYARGEAARAELVDLHRSTILAALAGRQGSHAAPRGTAAEPATDDGSGA